jgi:hypothetical protein
LRRNGSRTVITTCGEPGSFAGGIDATHLHRHRGEARHAQQENNDQGGDREGRLNCGSPGLIG